MCRTPSRPSASRSPAPSAASSPAARAASAPHAAPSYDTVRLVGHSADVAAVLQALLQLPVIARRLASLLGQDALTADDVARLVALVALHDLGKINLGFLRKPFPGGGMKAGHIAPMVAPMVAPVVALLGDDGASGRVIRRLLELGGLGRLKHRLCDAHDERHSYLAVLAHHGSLPGPGRGTPELWGAEPGHDPAAACAELVDAIHHWCPAASATTPIAWTPGFAHAFAGLVTLADWLGSDVQPFAMPEEGAPDGIGRFAWALAHARALLVRRGLAPEVSRRIAAALPWTGAALTGFADPSPAQAVAETRGGAPDPWPGRGNAGAVAGR